MRNTSTLPEVNVNCDLKEGPISSAKIDVIANVKLKMPIHEHRLTSFVRVQDSSTMFEHDASTGAGTQHSKSSVATWSRRSLRDQNPKKMYEEVRVFLTLSLPRVLNFDFFSVDSDCTTHTKPDPNYDPNLPRFRIRLCTV